MSKANAFDLNDRKPTFVSEPIKSVTSTADTRAMAGGGPGLPQEFTWRGERLRVVGVVRSWKEAGSCSHGSAEQYVRKHWFEVDTESHGRARIYFERQSRGRKSMNRWCLFSLQS